MTNTKKSFRKLVIGVLVAALTSFLVLPFAALAAVSDVQNLKATAGDAEVELSWTAVSGAQKYRIYLGTSSVGPNESYNMETLTTPDNKPKYTVDNLKNGTTYFFSVTAVGSSNTDESVNFSNEASATPKAKTTGSGSSATGESESKSVPKAGAPMLEKAESTSKTEVTLTFSESVVLPATEPKSAFTIIDNDNPEVFLDITKVALDPKDDGKVVLTTSAQAGKSYTVVVTRLNDTTGDAIDDEASTAEFSAFGGNAEDKTAPEDATSLKAVIDNLQTLAVALTWNKSLNTAGDLVRYVIYVKKGDGEFARHGDVAASQDAQAALKEIINGLEAQTTYSFKVTAVDASGNESQGVITSLTLPETGPGLAALAFGSLFGARSFVKRRKS